MIRRTFVGRVRFPILVLSFVLSFFFLFSLFFLFRWARDVRVRLRTSRPEDGAGGRPVGRHLPVRHVDPRPLVPAGRTLHAAAGAVVRARHARHARPEALHVRFARPVQRAGRPAVRRHVHHAHAAAARQRPGTNWYLTRVTGTRVPKKGSGGKRELGGGSESNSTGRTSKYFER